MIIINYYFINHINFFYHFYVTFFYWIFNIFIFLFFYPQNSFSLFSQSLSICYIPWHKITFWPNLLSKKKLQNVFIVWRHCHWHRWLSDKINEFKPSRRTTLSQAARSSTEKANERKVIQRVAQLLLFNSQRQCWNSMFHRTKPVKKSGWCWRLTYASIAKRIHGIYNLIRLTSTDCQASSGECS